MKKTFDAVCSSEHLDNLVSFRIKAKDKKTKIKNHKFIEKMIKRARILGLLPFTHMKLKA